MLLKLSLVLVACSAAALAYPQMYVTSPQHQPQQQQRVAVPQPQQQQQQQQYKLVPQPVLYQQQQQQQQQQPRYVLQQQQQQQQQQPQQQLVKIRPGQQPRQQLTAEPEPEDYDPNPQYQFSFDVKDDEFTNYQNRKEQREGDKITGSYSVVDSDGFIRTVKYTADPKEGFKAEVTREPTDIVVKLPTPPQSQLQSVANLQQELSARQQQTQQYIQASQVSRPQPQVYSTLAQQSPQQIATLQVLRQRQQQQQQFSAPSSDEQQYSVQPQQYVAVAPRAKAPKGSALQYAPQSQPPLVYQQYQQ